MATPVRVCRMISPSGASPITIFGRTYNPATAASQDIPIFDAAILSANGWVQLCLVGTTAARPVKSDGDNLPTNALPYYDTTLSKLIFWSGNRGLWVDPANGNAV